MSDKRQPLLVDIHGAPARVVVGVFLRRKCKHYAWNHGGGVTLCGYVVPDRRRWRFKRPERMWASCWECQNELSALAALDPTEAPHG